MANGTCSLCGSGGLDTDAEAAMQACDTCAKKLGVIPMPPARRPPAPCGRCNSRQFLRAIPREHSSYLNGEQNGQHSAPMYVTYPPDIHKGWILQYPKELDINTGVGLFEIYICRKCGFVEWYCTDVERIPAHPHLMTEHVGYEPDSPYR